MLFRSLLGVALQALALGPAVSRITAGYADLSLAPSLGDIALLIAGLGLLSLLAAGWTARTLTREPVAQGLREESS